MVWFACIDDHGNSYCVTYETVGNIEELVLIINKSRYQRGCELA